MLYPTFGHPGRPGYTLQTSGRLRPYVALPTIAPSTDTCTLLMAVPIEEVLSIAQPTRFTALATVDPGDGVSTTKLGGGAVTVTVTAADPVSGTESLSVADTVIV